MGIDPEYFLDHHHPPTTVAVRFGLVGRQIEPITTFDLYLSMTVSD